LECLEALAPNLARKICLPWHPLLKTAYGSWNADVTRLFGGCRLKELLGAQADPALFVKRALDKRFSARVLELENAEGTAWIKRLLKSQGSPQHPILHILVIRALRESAKSFS
jgi:hypothetical protein